MTQTLKLCKLGVYNKNLQVQKKKEKQLDYGSINAVRDLLLI